MIDIFPIIAKDPQCTALLGKRPTRFYPFIEAPQDGEKPYAVWQLVSGEPLNQLACRPAGDQYTVQIDAYGRDASIVREIARAVRAALESDNRATVTNWAREEYEHDTQLYRVSFDVDFFD